MMNASLRLSGLIAATALLAACGGGGGGGSSPTPPSSTNPPPSNPTPRPPPVNDALQYKGFLGASLGIVLGMDHVAKTFFELPAKIKTEVEQHGPFTNCTDSTCTEVDTSQWVSFPLDNGTVRLQDWDEIIDKDGVLGADERLELDVQGLGEKKISSQVHLFTPGAAGYMGLGFQANYELTREGLLLNEDPSRQYQGSMIVEHEEGKLVLRDHPTTATDIERQLIISEIESHGRNTWLTNYYSTTNESDLDAVTFDIDMYNYVGGGQLKLKSETPLNFGTMNGRMVLEAGSFVYDNKLSDSHVILRASVDADPAFLLVEIDANADGTYEKSGRIAQDDFNFNF